MILWHQAGQLLRYHRGVIGIRDRSHIPEVVCAWRATRWEVFRLGWRAIVAAVFNR